MFGLSVQAIHSISIARLLAGFAYELNIVMFPGVATSAREGTSLALPLHPHLDSPGFSVCRSQLTIQPNHDVTCAGAVMKTPPVLLRWKSPCQTWLPVALFPIHHRSFAASSASGNLSPQTQLTFLAEN